MAADRKLGRSGIAGQMISNEEAEITVKGEEHAFICVRNAVEEVEATEHALTVLFQMSHCDPICYLESRFEPGSAQPWCEPRANT